MDSASRTSVAQLISQALYKSMSSGLSAQYFTVLHISNVQCGLSCSLSCKFYVTALFHYLHIILDYVSYVVLKDLSSTSTVS